MNSVKTTGTRLLAKFVGALILLFVIAPCISSGQAFAGGSAYHTVTFAENDSPSDPVYATQTDNAPTALTSFSSLNPSFSNPGYTFVDWNTEPDGSGVSYSDGQVYGFGAELYLYAIWAGSYHTVTFVENDSSADNVSSTQTENSSSELTLFRDLNPSFSNPGYTFTNWNTQSNGQGTTYTDGQIYNFESQLTLYAVWNAQQTASYSASFSANGGSGSIADSSGISGTTIVLPSGSLLSDTGYTFSGWNTSADGEGSAYQAGESYDLTADVTFYAQWTPDQYIVSFDADGGVVSPASATFVVGGPALTLPTPTQAGAIFSGWYTSMTGGALVGGAGGSYQPTTSVTLYAQWGETPSIIVSFSVNGGSGSVPSIVQSGGSPVTLPGATSVIRSGYSLASWNTAANGSGTSYVDGATVTFGASTTLYAQWTADRANVLFGVVGIFPRSTTALSPGLKSQVIRLAKMIKVRDYKDVTLYGYTSATGLVSLNRSISERRALNVADFLRTSLGKLKVKGVKITAAGEGAIGGRTSSSYSRVEVFGQ